MKGGEGGRTECLQCVETIPFELSAAFRVKQAPVPLDFTLYHVQSRLGKARLLMYVGTNVYKAMLAWNHFRVSLQKFLFVGQEVI